MVVQQRGTFLISCMLPSWFDFDELNFCISSCPIMSRKVYTQEHTNNSKCHVSHVTSYLLTALNVGCLYMIIHGT